MDLAAAHSRPRVAPKAAVSSPSAEASGSVTKRLGNELMQLMMSNSPGISAFPRSDSNLFDWIGTIEGPAGTVYAGLTFKINMTFPNDYPYSAPKIHFESPCYHPNVDLQGNICLDILQDKWSAVYSAHTILLSLQSLLGGAVDASVTCVADLDLTEPNNASPLNNEAAQSWGTPDFKAQMLRHYRSPDAV